MKKTKNKEQKKNNDSISIESKDLNVFEATKNKAVDLDHDYGEDLCANLLAYNIPVASNPFTILDEQSENNDFNASKDNNSNSEASKHGIEEEKDTKLLKQEKRFMSPEQERAFLTQFEKILIGPLSNINIKEPT